MENKLGSSCSVAMVTENIAPIVDILASLPTIGLRILREKGASTTSGVLSFLMTTQWRGEHVELPYPDGSLDVVETLILIVGHRSEDEDDGGVKASVNNPSAFSPWALNERLFSEINRLQKNMGYIVASQVTLQECGRGLEADSLMRD